ncbi:hypothetical protein PHYSODRAFT_531243 [Phytophthora sojae]|uniref:DDE-1 domain-containing protein n=1 Tax=Phytophthora sojae (strain P6497) TaxID=1094619 RepID=G5ADT8_PHYSP|nr:hypothetical protein PHYSODRAFT_531243 [Phytophthora sojae]EGZ06340.1 hypothetical protein PHYSODRAFT_531243 [Phytophthora sojae]|eukprot:XP_009538237.1 hypothetical protein PHYSODRAFT_531243 [Phytophthora sojae]
MLVALPANATHLFQPLDVALLKPFKDCTTAIGMACTAYRRTLIDQPTSAVNGFRECGIWPLSMVQLKSRLTLYKGGGVKGEIRTG